MMSDINKLDTIFDWVRMHPQGDAPAEAQSLLGADKGPAIEVAQQLSIDDLIALLDAMVPNSPNAAIALRLVEVTVEQLLRKNRTDTVRRIFSHPLTRSRDVATVIGRISYAGHTHHLLRHEDVYDLLEPAGDFLIENANPFILQLSWFVIAAHFVGDQHILMRAAEAIGDDIGRDPPALPGAAAISRRILMLKRLGLDISVSPLEWPHWDRDARQCTMYLDRWHTLQAIAALRLIDITAAAQPGLMISAIAAVCREYRWGRAYWAAQGLAEHALRHGIAFDILLKPWLAAGLPGAALALAQRRANAGSAADLALGRAAFTEAPSLALAQRIWHEFAVRGDAEATGLYGVLDDVELESARLARATRDQPAKTAPFWLFMTWRDGSPRLLSNIAHLLPSNGRVVVSIGGSGRPSALAQATTAMLVPGVYLLNRAPLSWGGPRLLFENVLDVMRLFREKAPENAWLQVICDRSLPLRNMEDIAELYNDPKKVVKLGRFVGVMQSWNGELEPDQIANLPDVLRHSIDQIFEVVDPEALLALAGPSRLWPTQPIDHRLNAFIFNFSREARPTSDNDRIGDKVYAVSPFDADIKWMSFSRLQSFIDVTAEQNSTYSRRMPPMMADWVHQTLLPLDLRNGEPFLAFDQRYVAAMFDHEGFDRIASAMHLSFGPEMSFFDTMRATLGMEDNALHVYTRVDAEVVQDRHMPELAIGADIQHHSFIRKVDATESAQVVRNLAEDARLAGEWRETYWVASGPDVATANDDLLPRLDHELFDQLIEKEFVLRDMLSRATYPARLDAGGILRSPDNVLNGIWSFDGTLLTVDVLGRPTKHYCAYAASAERLVLVPDELVGPFNAWSQFLDFPLDTLTDSSDALSIAPLPLDTQIDWDGAGRDDIALLAAFAKGDGALAAPAFQKRGALHGFRRTDYGWLALASVDQSPILLRLTGAARGGGRIAHRFAKAGQKDVAEWHAAVPATPTLSLERGHIPGEWELETIDATRRLTFGSDNVIFDGDRRVGRWLLRADGIHILGVEGVRSGIASQYSVQSGLWRLAGWGHQMLGQPVSFTLTCPPRSIQ